MAEAFYRLKSAGGDWTRVTGEAPITITGLSAGEVYEYVVGNGTIGEVTAGVAATAPAQMTAPALAGGVEEATLTLASAPSDGGSAITSYAYQVDTAAGDFSSPIATGTQSPANLGTPIDVSPLVAGEYKARSWAINAVGAGTPSEASANATVTEAVANSITIETWSYDRGDPGVAPTTTGTYSTTGTLTGPFTLFWATRSVGTALSKTAIENGTGDALDNDSFPANTLAELVDIVMTLANSLSSGAIDVFIRDSSGTPVEIDVASATGVTYDAVAPGFASAAIEDATPSTMTLTLGKDAYVKVGETLEVADFTFGGTIAANVNGVTRTNATTYTFTLSTPAESGDTLTVALPTGTLVGIDAVDVAFTAQSVTNNVAAAGYTQSIVDNQGTGYLTVPADMIPASNIGTLSFWVSSKGIDTLGVMTGGNRPRITFSGTTAIRIVLKREGTNTEQYNRLITGVLSEVASAPTHVHIDWNFHASDPALSTVTVSIDGVQNGTDTEGIDVTNGFGNVWWSIAQGILARPDGSLLSNRAVADFYMESGVRRAVSLFYDGGPVDLTGVGAPQVLVNGDAAAWNAGTNNGSGGALTVGSATFVDV